LTWSLALALTSGVTNRSQQGCEMLEFFTFILCSIVIFLAAVVYYSIVVVL